MSTISVFLILFSLQISALLQIISVCHHFQQFATKRFHLALDFIRTCDTNNKFIIFSDSFSVLKAMNHTSSKNPRIQKLLEKCHERLASKKIVLCWIYAV